MFDFLRNAVLGLAVILAGLFGYQELIKEQEKQPVVKEVSEAFIITRIERAEPGTKDKKQWAKAITSGLHEFKLPASKDYVCGVIAIIDQESSFNENPVVPGIANLAISELNKKVDSVPLFSKRIRKYLTDTGAYAQLKKAKTERDLDLAQRKIIQDVVNRFNLNGVGGISFFASLIDGKNKITTLGAMQSKLDVETARQKAKSLTDIYRVRDFMYTKEGVVAGINVLWNYKADYSSFIYRAADYNAGRYTSRNVGFQYAIAKLLNKKITLDGDLLGHSLLNTVKQSETEKSISELNTRFNLGFSIPSIRLALRKEKDYDFVSTNLYKSINDLYKKEVGSSIPKEMLPDIKLSSLKVKSGFTTKRFAENVNRRFAGCMKN